MVKGEPGGITIFGPIVLFNQFAFVRASTFARAFETQAERVTAGLYCSLWES
jgi:hypothetical protein